VREERLVRVTRTYSVSKGMDPSASLLSMSKLWTNLLFRFDLKVGYKVAQSRDYNWVGMHICLQAQTWRRWTWRRCRPGAWPDGHRSLSRPLIKSSWAPSLNFFSSTPKDVYVALPAACLADTHHAFNFSLFSWCLDLGKLNDVQSFLVVSALGQICDNMWGKICEGVRLGWINV